MINVSELIHDVDFSQVFFLYRTEGSIIKGRWVSSPEKRIRIRGVIVPASAKSLSQFPEADRPTGSIEIFIKIPIYMTKEGQLSDKVFWKNQIWKVLSVSDLSDFGVYRAVAERIKNV